MRGVVNRPFERELPSPIPPHPAEHLLTPERVHRFRQVLARRTGRLAVVVEECYDPQNATAVVRTCDALGIHRVHAVTGANTFRVNRRVSQGAHLNLDLRFHAAIDEAYGQLRGDGFRILCTDLAADAVVGPGRLQATLDEGPLAIVFGNEGHGLSDAALAGADGSFCIPMAGFPQSLNLSVTVAICCYTLRRQALENDEPGDLPPEAQARWYDAWLRRSRNVERYCAEHGFPPPDERAILGADKRGNPEERFDAGS